MALAVEMAAEHHPSEAGRRAAGLRGSGDPEGRTGSEGRGCVALTAGQVRVMGNADSYPVGQEWNATC